MESLDDIQKFVIQFQPDGIIIDTNILILFLIGSYKPDFIKNYTLLTNSNKTYSTDDFEILKKIFSYFKTRVITPHIISEISNLSITNKNNLYGNEFMLYLQTVIKQLKAIEERYQKSACLWGMELKVISDFGFIDMTMFELAKQTKMPILTDDLNFYIYSLSQNVPIIKFQNLKNKPYQLIFSN